MDCICMVAHLEVLLYCPSISISNRCLSLCVSVCLVIGFLMLYCMFGLFAFGSGIMWFSLLNLACLNTESSHQALLTGHWWGGVCVCEGQTEMEVWDIRVSDWLLFCF